jgi:hypothetical protein
MSEAEEDKFMERLEKWDAKHAKHDFIAKMGRKLNRKERYGRG